MDQQPTRPIEHTDWMDRTVSMREFRSRRSGLLGDVTQRDVLQNKSGRSTMSATLRLVHKAIGVEVRRGTYDVMLDGERVGPLELNHPIEVPVEPGHHTLQVRNGRNSSRTKTFDATEGETVAFRCSGKSILPIFLLSFVVPSLALSLHRE
jgi:hypothetical protein